MDRWFWIVRSLRERASAQKVDLDLEYIDALIKMLYTPYFPKGDGKFSRLEHWLESVDFSLELAKANLTCKDDALYAYFLGLMTAIEGITAEVQLIKKGR